MKYTNVYLLFFNFSIYFIIPVNLQIYIIYINISLGINLFTEVY